MKVLGVGLSRTGNTSLARALTVLGYKTVHFDTHFIPRLERAGITGRLDLSRYDTLDAVTDTPAGLFYEEFLQRYPDLKCILTVRDETDWLASILDNYRRLPLRSQKERGAWRFPETTWYGRTLSFGTTAPNRYLFLKRYRAHTQAVLNHVPPEQLLVMNLCAGAGWETLCPFLGLEPPDTPFPWLNQS